MKELKKSEERELIKIYRKALLDFIREEDPIKREEKKQLAIKIRILIGI